MNTQTKWTLAGSNPCCILKPAKTGLAIVGECESADDAAQIVKEHNIAPEMAEALRAAAEKLDYVLAYPKGGDNAGFRDECQGCAADARALLARLEG